MILLSSILLGFIHVVALINYDNVDLLYSLTLIRLIMTTIYNFSLECDCNHSEIMNSIFRDTLLIDIYYMISLQIIDAVYPIIISSIGFYTIACAINNLRPINERYEDDHLISLIKCVSYFMMTIAHISILSSF